MEKEIIKIIKKEIEWCENNKSQEDAKYCEGFIKGLKQSIILINGLKEHESEK